MTQFSTRLAAPVALALAAAGLAACSDEAAEAGVTSEEQADSTVAEILANNSDLSTVASALSGAGLDTVFDGAGSYTILAPTNAAFEALGESGEELVAEENRAVLVAILRGQVVPGHLTHDAIIEAIEQSGGPVEMRTLAGGIATFSAEDGVVNVVGSVGSTVQVSGKIVAGSNGVVMPVDGLLEVPEPPE